MALAATAAGTACGNSLKTEATRHRESDERLSQAAKLKVTPARGELVGANIQLSKGSGVFSL
jgi:hypothetical protein